ncbi:MAG: hypothetical protein H6550_07560 [Chitinophagales bacterium]|nr:hypothetical protein [Chitinophagales bacterium]
MKFPGSKGKILLLCSLISTTAFAQRGAIEVALGGGMSINSNPGKNMTYKGSKMTLNYSSGFSLMFNPHRSVSAGIEARMLELSRKSPDVTYPTYLKTTIGGDNRRFVYSKSLLSGAVVVNGKYNLPRGYAYGGGALGYALSTHDSKTFNTNKESYRAPDGGNGIMFGLQAGYTHGISEASAVFVDIALRNYSLKYDAGAPEVRPYEDLHYNITAYTITAGLKLRIMPKYRLQNDIPAFRGRGRSYKPRRIRGPRR